jgi:hypothetical protein
MTEADDTSALRVPDAPSVPLARTVAMPEGLDFSTGTLHFRVTDLQISPTGPPETADGTVSLPPLDVTAGYVIEATRDDIAEYDGGGDLSALPASATAPNGGYVPTTQEREEWVELATTHRTRLRQLRDNDNNENARQLLAAYDEHKEVYADLFDPNKTGFVKEVWRPSQGADTTAKMSKDTHGAVSQENAVINPNESERTYTSSTGVEKGYNYNAFDRHGGVLAHIPELDEDYMSGKTDEPAQKYQDAMNAAGHFKDNVTAHTSNTSSKTTSLTAQQVYDKVNDTTVKPVGPSRDWVTAVLNPFADDVWEGWDDDERDLIRGHRRTALRTRAARVANAAPTALFTGTCTARVTDVVVSTGPTGRVQVTVPSMRLEIDDSGWPGAAGEVARERLGNSAFFADLVRDAIRERLRQAAADGDARVTGDQSA